MYYTQDPIHVHVHVHFYWIWSPKLTIVQSQWVIITWPTHSQAWNNVLLLRVENWNTWKLKPLKSHMKLLFIINCYIVSLGFPIQVVYISYWWDAQWARTNILIRTICSRPSKHCRLWYVAAIFIGIWGTHNCLVKYMYSETRPARMRQPTVHVHVHIFTKDTFHISNSVLLYGVNTFSTSNRGQPPYEGQNS